MHINLSSQDRVIKYLDCFKFQISYTLTENVALALHTIQCTFTRKKDFMRNNRILLQHKGKSVKN
jgi:hypothetical protein